MDTSRLTHRFEEPLPPLERPERLGFVLMSVVVAISRWPAIAKSLWDWDEALFVLAMRNYDVAAYHPHPPGFPLFIAAAKLIPLEPFRALQTVVVLSSLLLFPAAFFFARELRADRFVTAASALLLAFLPNVWFFGGTAFSDVPSLVLSLTACALLLRGCRSDAALLGGCVVLGMAAGIRPQNLVIGFVPFALAFLSRRGTALRGLAATAVIVAVSYGAAAAATGDLKSYLAALSEHGRYIRNVDSFLAPGRPSLIRVADDFFLRPFRAPVINVILVALCAIAVVRRRAHTIAAVAIFGPFLVFAWLFLDFHSASRFSIAYMPMFAILAADGLSLVPGRARVPVLAGLLAIVCAWTFPVLWLVHRTDSPPAAALRFIRSSADPNAFFVKFDDSLGPHVAVYLPRHNASGVNDRRRVLRVTEGPGRQTFTRPRERLAGIVRPRYFEVSVSW